MSGADVMPRAAEPTRDAAGSGASRGRRGRALAVSLVAGLVLLVALLVALAGAGSPSVQPLDPDDTGPSGASAVAAVLARQGVRVRRVDTAREIPGDGATTVLVTDASRLSPEVLDRLASGAGPLVLLAPDGPTLERLTPAVTADDGRGEGDHGPVYAPRCEDADARAAGDIDVSGGWAYRVDDDSADAQRSVRCYPTTAAPDPGAQEAAWRGTRAAAEDDDADTPSLLVRTRLGGRQVDVLGAPEVFSNAGAVLEGNAALALRLAGRTADVAWYLPAVTERGDGDAALSDLVPRPVTWAIVHLLVAGVIALLWVGRRQARLVTEPLPVVVRAGETEEGRARLYVRARARGRSAAILRTAALRRIARRLDVPVSASPDLVVTMTAARTGRHEAQVRDLLAGAPPQDDRELVRLAAALDALEDDVGRT